MAGASIRIDVDGIEATERRLGVLAARLGDLTPLMDIFGAVLVADAQDNFAGEHGPDGLAWEKSQRAKDEGGKTLQDSRRLYLSLTHVATSRSVEVGTNVVYAARHQKGWSGTEQVRQHVRRMSVVFGVRLREPIDVTVGAFERQGSTPARPFIGISADARAEMEAQFEDYAGGAA